MKNHSSIEERGSIAHHMFAGVAVADYEQALVLHERLFGRSPNVIVAKNEAMWQLTETGWIYIVGDASSAGSALLTILVNNLEDHVADLEGRGLETSAKVTRGVEYCLRMECVIQ